MAIDISSTTRRIVYTGSAGTGPYAYNFEILAQTDLAVYFNDTELTLTTDFTVSIDPDGTGSITIVVGTNVPTTPDADDRITIVGARTIERTTDFTTGGPLFATTLNDEFDSLTIFTQQNKEESDRAIKAPVTDPSSIDMTLPKDDDRKGKYLSFNATTGNPEVVNNVVDITTIAGIASDVTTVSGIASNVTTVAGNASNINTVATNISSVNTVAANIADVITVANDLAEAISEVETVANDLNEATSEIDTVAVNIANVNTVGLAIANVNTVASISANVTSVATNATNINTVAGISANVTTVAGISANVTAVAGNTANIATVAGLSTDIQTLADIEDGTVASSAITGVAAIASNVTSVATNASNVNTVATNITNVNTVGTNIVNVNSVATNISNVNTVAGISANIATVAGISTDVTTVAGIYTNVASVANIDTDVTAVAAIATDVTTAANNITDISNFADIYYGPSATAPSTRKDGSALQDGDLYFDTVGSQLYIRDSGAWDQAAFSVSGAVTSFNTRTGAVTLSAADVNTALGSDAVLDSDIGSTVQAYDADTTKNDVANTFTANQTINGDLTVDTNTLYVDSTNNRVGIGTSSPSYKLHSAGTVGSGSTGTNGSYAFRRSSDGAELATVAVDGTSLIYNSGLGTHIWQDAGTERMRIDSSGNVGIGTTAPLSKLNSVASNAAAVTALTLNNSNSGFAADEAVDIDFGVGSSVTAAHGKLRVANKTATSGSNSYMSFYTRAADVLAEKMRIDSSGNVGIGTSSPDYRLTIQSASASALNRDSVIRVGDQTNFYRNSMVYNGSASAIGAFPAFSGGIYWELGGGFGASGGLVLATNSTSAGPVIFGTNDTERMRITSAGNVGIGTSSPTTKLNVVSTNAGNNSVGLLLTNLSNTSGTGATIGFSPYNDNTTLTGSISNYNESSGSYSMRFNTWNSVTNAERMRIDSGGALLVGTTTNASSAAKVVVSSTAPQMAINGNGAGVNSLINWTTSGTTKAQTYFDATNTRFYIACDNSGGVYLASGGTSWTSASDERIKDIIEPIENAVEKIGSWRAIIGKYKTDEDGTRRSFLIAQDVLETFPEAVDATNEEELGVRYQDTIPVLVKAIQEQQDIIKALETRIQTLENK